MVTSSRQNTSAKISKRGFPNLLKPYSGMVALLILFALLSNGVNLLLPRIISRAIDAYTNGNFVMRNVVFQFSGAVLIIFVFTYKSPDPV